jgi:hypothetical protein
MESNIIKKGSIETGDVKPAQGERIQLEKLASAGQDELVKRLHIQVVQSRSLEAVSMSRLQEVAIRHAAAIWGPDIACGEPLQLVDMEDEPIAYAFPCAIGSREIPTTEELIKQFGDLRRAAGVSDRPHGEGSALVPFSVAEQARQYGTIYVSARRGDYPVTRVSYGLHPYFYRGEQALSATGLQEARLSKLRYTPPYEFFEIQAGDSVSLLHTDTLLSDAQLRDAMPRRSVPRDSGAAVGEPEADRVEQIEAAWKAYEEEASEDRGLWPLPPPPLPTYEFLIRYWERMPAINWTRWCEPTAACMVFSFWDHYVPVPGIGTHVGYERIVDYWYDHVSNGNNVPDIMDPIADGPNSDVANVQKGYNWSVDKVWGYPSNDWAWNELTGHLHRHLPLVWQVHADGFDHAVAAFGYRIAFGQKYVHLYTTWSDDPVLARAEWLYNEYAGKQMSAVEVDRYVPGGRELYRAMFIYRPYGGETYHLNQWNEIRFYVHPQSDIKIARIEYSLDGGRTWGLVVEIWAQPNWNRWWWKPAVTSSKARIRIKGMSQGRKHLAGSGSFGNFTIE